MVYSHTKEKPHLNRICIQIQIVRNIAAWYDFGNKKSFKDFAKMIQFNQMQTLGFQAVMAPISIYEKAIVHLPLSIIYQFLMSLGTIRLYY